MLLTQSPTLRSACVALFCVVLASCGRDTWEQKRPRSLCSQPIPHSKQQVFEFRFDGEWATTSDPWGYAIHGDAAQVSMRDQLQLPKGRLFKVGSDGSVQLVSFTDYDPRVGEKTIRHVVNGVTVIETIFNSDNNGWRSGGDYRFDGVEAAGDRIAFIAVKDEGGKLLHERLEVDAGGIVARSKDGIVQSLQRYRVDPDPATTPAGTRRRFLIETYTPAQSSTLSVAQLPARGICK